MLDGRGMATVTPLCQDRGAGVVGLSVLLTYWLSDVAESRPD